MTFQSAALSEAPPTLTQLSRCLQGWFCGAERTKLQKEVFNSFKVSKMSEPSRYEVKVLHFGSEIVYKSPKGNELVGITFLSHF